MEGLPRLGDFFGFYPHPLAALVMRELIRGPARPGKVRTLAMLGETGSAAVAASLPWGFGWGSLPECVESWDCASQSSFTLNNRPLF